MIHFLIWVGFIRRRGDGTIRWPFHISPFWMWKMLLLREPFIGFFRNRPSVIKWLPGRLLPRRWGVRIWFFEFGDRG